MDNSLPVYSGDVTGLLGRQLNSNDFGPIGQQIGKPNADNGTMFQSNGNVYRFDDSNGNGTRNLVNVGSLGDYQSGQATQAASALAAKQKAELDANFAQNRSDLTQYGNELAATVPQVTNTANSLFNVGGLTNIANALSARIDDLKGNTSGAGGGGFVNSSQVDSALNTNYLPRFQTANNQAQTASTLAQNYTTQNLIPIETKGQMLSDQIARQSTGYSAQQQNELQGLMTAIQAGTTLTEAQMKNANDLAIAHLNYESAKYSADQQLQGYVQQAQITNKFKEIPYLGGLYDTSTNQQVGGQSSFTPSYATGSSGGGGTSSSSSNNSSGPSIGDLQAWVGQSGTNSNSSLGFSPIPISPTPARPGTPNPYDAITSWISGLP